MDYTTLGDGNATKLLAVTEHSAARTVTSLPNAAARAASYALGCTHRRLPAALYDVAVDADGAPVDARRHLLSVFDRTERCRGGRWSPAEHLVVTLADTLDGVPAAARAAVRDELDGHLAGFGGVLVPATITAWVPKVVTLDLVVSGPLEWLGDGLWGYLLGAHGDLGVHPADDGTALVASVDLDYPLVMELYDADPVGDGFADMGVADMVAASSDAEPPSLEMTAAHLLAWVAHHRPDDLAAVTERLTPPGD